MGLFTKQSFLLTACVALAACSSPPPDPPRLKSKVGTGEAILQTNATKLTTKATNVASWQVTRGKQNFVVKGYDAHGKVVAGIAVGFHKKTDSSPARVTANMLDGSKWSMEHHIGGSTTSSGKMSLKSKILLNAMFTDIEKVHHGMKAGTASVAHAKASCGTDLVDTLMNSLQCMASASTPTAKDMCMVSMKSASSSASTCDSTSNGVIKKKLPKKPTTSPTGSTIDDGDVIVITDDDSSAQGGQMPGGGTEGQIDPETGFPIDPQTGMPIDPQTGEPIPIDPQTGEPLDPDAEDGNVDDGEYDPYDDGADLDDGYEDGDYGDYGDYDGDGYGDDVYGGEGGGEDGMYAASLRLFRR